MDEHVKAMLDEISGKIDAYKAQFGELGGRVQDLDAKVQQLSALEQKLSSLETSGVKARLREEDEIKLDSLRLELDAMRDRMNGPAEPAGTPAGSGIIARAQENDRFKEAIERNIFGGGGGIKFSTKANLEGFGLATISSSAVGSSTPGIITPQRVQEYVPSARPRLTLRDILRSRTTTSNTVEFVKQVMRALASPQGGEGAAKFKTGMTFEIQSEPVRTLAAWAEVTAQVLDDWASLRQIVEEELMFALKEQEENQILLGSGTGQDLDGLITQATAYDTARNVSGDTKLDQVRRAIGQAQAANEPVDFIVLHPDEVQDIELIKDQASNVGNYVAGAPLGSTGFPRLWGRTLIETTAMPSGDFLVGNSRAAEIFDRKQAVITISNEHEEYFTKNLVAILVEERIALAVYRPGAFIYGTLTGSPS